MSVWPLPVSLTLASLVLGFSFPQKTTSPSSSPFDPARLARLDAVIHDAIAARETPGAVVLVGQGDRVLFRKAWGDRALVPRREAMTIDTIFDLASLTKVVATTTAVMMLIEDGRVRLVDPIAKFIPEFGKYGKDRVTIRDLLTHMSGLRPDVDVSFDWVGYNRAIELASEEILTAPPGRRFVYSDINYFLLAEVVARVSGPAFDRFVRDRIFVPHGMKDTM